MIHIVIPDRCFEEISTQSASNINNYLAQNCCQDNTSPQCIYDYLHAVTAEKLLSISLSDMDNIIKDIQALPGWSTLGITNCKGEKDKWKDCNTCKCNGMCKIQHANTIHKDLVDFFEGKYKAWCQRPRYFRPYDFIKQLNIKACPYCNLEYVQIATFSRNYSEGNKFVRPALDHFYPKSKYPFFAISLYNLVPCCTTCNSSIKSDNEIGSYVDCVHPYDIKIDYHNNIRYKLLLLSSGARKILSNQCPTSDSVCNLYGNWIIYDAYPQNGEQVPNGYIRAKNNYEYFAIKERIEQGFSDYISEIYQKTLEYPLDYINDLRSRGYSATESFRLLFANYIKPEDFNKRPLSKITHDIIEQLRPEILEELEKEI